MAEGKTLNLDQFLPPKKAVQLEGVEYEVLPLCVETFLNMSGMLEKFQEAQKGQDTVGTIRASLDILGAMVPELPRERVQRLPVHALQTLVEYVVAGIADAEEGEPGSPPAEGGEAAP